MARRSRRGRLGDPRGRAGEPAPVPQAGHRPLCGLRRPRDGRRRHDRRRRPTVSEGAGSPRPTPTAGFGTAAGSPKAATGEIEGVPAGRARHVRQEDRHVGRHPPEGGGLGFGRSAALPGVGGDRGGPAGVRVVLGRATGHGRTARQENSPLRPGVPWPQRAASARPGGSGPARGGTVRPRLRRADAVRPPRADEAAAGPPHEPGALGRRPAAGAAWRLPRLRRCAASVRTG